MISVAFLLIAVISLVLVEGDVSLQKATFAGGCFWGAEKVFSEMKGVAQTRVGYTGGRTQDPSYEDVCAGMTGHAEAIEIVFNPTAVSYEKLLETFFRHHDPTTLNRQGPDIGTQYRSAIFTHDEAQKKAAQRAEELLNRAKIFKGPVVTEISAAGAFYEAEGYHQKYLKKNPQGYCSLQLQSEKIEQILGEGMKG